MHAPFKIKANLSCTGCIASVTPHLNLAAGPGNWSAVLTSPGAIITVSSGKSTVQQALQALVNAGYNGALM